MEEQLATIINLQVLGNIHNPHGRGAADSLARKGAWLPPHQADVSPLAAELAVPGAGSTLVSRSWGLDVGLTNGQHEIALFHL